MTEVVFKEGKAGEWEQPIPSGYLNKCCDCGLVHRFDFRVVKNHKRGNKATIQNQRYRVQFRVYRVDS